MAAVLAIFAQVLTGASCSLFLLVMQRDGNLTIGKLRHNRNPLAPDNVGMVISTSDASNYEVTSGNVKFTKVSKPNNRFQSRTEGIFNFTFYDKVHDEEYVCSGKFMLEV